MTPETAAFLLYLLGTVNINAINASPADAANTVALVQQAQSELLEIIGTEPEPEPERAAADSKKK